MGMEDGSNYFDSGGSGDIGAGGDFNYGYGAGGDSFAIDYGAVYGDIGVGGDFNYGYGQGEPGPVADSINWGNIGAGSDFNYGYGFDQPLDTGLWQGPIGGEQTSGDTFTSYLDFYTAMGLDQSEAVAMAKQATEALTGEIVESVGTETPLPDASLPTMPLSPFTYGYWQTPYAPTFEEPSAPLPPVYWPNLSLIPPPMPPSVPGPMPGGSSGTIPIAPGLPPACPGGQYHPYPIGHPQQNVCIPFPVATSPAPQPGPKGQSSSGGAQAPKQQQQPKCPTGYYLDPLTKQCKPIPQGQPQNCPTGYYRASNGQCLPIPPCTTPGTVFDAARGLCVPQGQAISPVSEEGVFGDLLNNLKEIPWWIWLAAGGLLLLSRDDGGKKTTVTYRKAS